MRAGRRRQAGLGVIGAIMVLLILAALAAAITTFTSGQHMAGAQDIQSARAWQVVQAGTEWGLYQALKNNSCPNSASWAHPDHAEFKVTVGCVARTYNEGETVPGTARQMRVFEVTATACNGSASSCPDNGAAAAPGYVERQRSVVAYCEWNGGACTGP